MVGRRVSISILRGVHDVRQVRGVRIVCMVMLGYRMRVHVVMVSIIVRVGIVVISVHCYH